MPMFYFIRVRCASRAILSDNFFYLLIHPNIVTLPHERYEWWEVFREKVT